MGRLRRGHSLEVIFEEETTQFQPSIARLEEEEYINAIFSQKILSGGCIFSSASAPEEKGGHTQKSRIPLHYTQKKIGRHIFSCSAYGRSNPSAL